MTEIFRVWNPENKQYELGCALEEDGTVTDEIGKERANWIVEFFFGLNDCNGDPIYVGDIVRIAGIGECVAMWNNKFHEYHFKSIRSGLEFPIQDVIEDIEHRKGVIHDL
jgi:hypothetical protein